MWNDDGARDDELPPALAAHVRALRAEEPVRPAWRARVLRALAQAEPPRRTRPAWLARRWSVRPAAAVAAALACMALGAGAAWRVARSVRPGPVAAARAPDGAVVEFALLAPGASRVALVGDFNRWDPSATPLTAAGDGRTWVVRVPLSAGRHVYSFVVDGRLVADPAAPRAADDDFGAPSSVALVAGAS